jgi:hypothetical protein
MTPFRAPGEIPACSRCAVRLEPNAVQLDRQGRPLCPPCKARVDGAVQDQKALAVYLPLVLVFSFVLVALMFAGIGFAFYRAAAHH